MSEEFHGTVRVRKWGSSLVITLPKEIRDFLGIVRRDLVAYRKVGRYVVLRRISGAELLPVTNAEAKRDSSSVGL
jgi:bifunctional DNA-binding transcriptional regulator/antitoxin component of YhaV-PrlF toxin-antitoxin module